jgi:hypothetical protein
MNPIALTVFVDRAYLVFFANCEPQLTGCYIADTRAALTPLWVDDAAKSCGTSNLPAGVRRPSLEIWLERPSGAGCVDGGADSRIRSPEARGFFPVKPPLRTA